jgi:hypothetical protein
MSKIPGYNYDNSYISGSSQFGGNQKQFGNGSPKRTYA